MSYLPHTDEDRRLMREAIGVSSVDELFASIPFEMRRDGIDLPDGLSEPETRQALERFAQRNRIYRERSFLGAGSYNHYVPAAVRALAGRAEFATAYTPYQAEVAQGTLQHIFEFQTAMCELTGLEVANASLYDGPSALAEAAFLALRQTNRERIAASAGIHPEALAVLRTYASGPDFPVEVLPLDEGGRTAPIDASDLNGAGAVLIQQPNVHGVIEDYAPLVEAAHEAGALAVVSQYPVSLGLLAAPGALGADIAVGDVQPFGNARSFGGPSAGYMVTRMEFLRQLPGRLVGRTVDAEGREAYALTLQAREQHIRRSRATSNICSNQALNALAGTIHLALLGPAGLREMACICVKRAHHLAAGLAAIDGVELRWNNPFFNEFCLRLPVESEDFLESMRTRGFDAGVALARLWRGEGEAPEDAERTVLIAVTEMNTPADLEAYVEAATDILRTQTGEGGGW